MNAPEFDQYSQSYQSEIEKVIGQYGGRHDHFLISKIDCLHRIALRHLAPPATLRILDVGCGPGLTTSLMSDRFLSATGLDVSSGLLDYAKSKHANSKFVHYDGSVMPFVTGTFDVAVAINVFHHIPPYHRDNVLAEMLRVVRPGGMVALIEHNPYNPLTMRVVRACAFDKDAILLNCRESRCRMERAGLIRIQSRYVLFLPFPGMMSALTDRLLAWLPLGAQYMAFGFKPN